MKPNVQLAAKFSKPGILSATRAALLSAIHVRKLAIARIMDIALIHVSMVKKRARSLKTRKKRPKRIKIWNNLHDMDVVDAKK